MITEIALLHIRENESEPFEAAFNKAQTMIASMKGYIGHELLKCMEKSDRYLLIVRWEMIEDHTEGFRKHEKYAAWKALLHHFYDPFPVVEHYKPIEN